MMPAYCCDALSCVICLSPKLEIYDGIERNESFSR